MGRNNTDKSLQQTKQPLEKGSAAQLANVCDASSGNYFGFNLLLCTDGWFGYGISKL